MKLRSSRRRLGAPYSASLLALVLLACAESSDPGASTTVTRRVITTTTSAPTVTTTTVEQVEIMGRVVGGEGHAPLHGATVSFGNGTTTSAVDGDFTLTAPSGSTLRVEKPGWVTAERQVDQDGFHLVALRRFRARGLRVSAGAAADDASFSHILDLAAASAVNTLVFDTKQEGGQVLYETSVAKAGEIGAIDVWYDPVERLRAAKQAGLYTITRIVSFEDAIWVRAHPEEKLAWVWVDPRAPTFRKYIIDLAVEACELGFDEIQFDYARFPAGRTAQVSGHLDLSQTERVAAIESFLAEARAVLEPMGCAVSVDIFAIVVSVPDDQGLGQRPEELSRHVDALSPMVYPSHYSLGWLGYPNPNDHPYEVTAAALDDALARLDGEAVLRPWLQGFWWTNTQIREAIQAAEDRGVGWLLWNVRSVFDLSALPSEAELVG